MNIYTIYKLTNIVNNKEYIGWTSREPSIRINEHYDGPADKMVISAAIQKYGKENFKWCILYQTIDYDHSREMEGYFILEYNTLVPNGYNVDLGGCGHKRSKTTIEKHRIKMKGRTQSEEHKRKIGLAVTGEKNGMFGVTGEEHPSYGTILNETLKRKISIAQKERLAKAKEDGTYKHHQLLPEEIDKMKVTKRLKRERGIGVKYDKVRIEGPDGTIYELGFMYRDFFKKHNLNNFMHKSIAKPGISIKKYTLLYYELKHN